MARPRSDAARAKVLAVVLPLALEKGLAAVTIDEVVRRSGVAKTTIYRHFASRNALLIAALDAAIDPPEAPDQGSLQADLRAFLGHVRPIFASPQVRALSFEISAAALRDPELGAMRDAFFTGRMGPLMSVVTRAQARGEVGEIDLVDAVGIIEGPFMVWSLTEPSRIDDADLDQLAAAAAQRLRAAAVRVQR